MILGKDYVNYEEGLSDLKLESLNKRRETMALKFVKNSLGNKNFSKMFPLKEVKHGMKSRRSEKYVVNSSNTNRHRDSAVPYLQGLLNRDDLERRQNLKRLLSDAESSLKYQQRQTNNRVNYIIHVDVIT